MLLDTQGSEKYFCLQVVWRLRILYVKPPDDHVTMSSLKLQEGWVSILLDTGDREVDVWSGSRSGQEKEGLRL